MKGPRQAGAQPLRRDKVGVAEGAAIKRNNKFPTGFFDPEDQLFVGEDDELVDVGEKGKQENVEDDDPGVQGAPGDDAFESRNPTFELRKGTLADVNRASRGTKGYPQVHTIRFKANPHPAFIHKPLHDASRRWSGRDYRRFLLVYPEAREVAEGFGNVQALEQERDRGGKDCKIVRKREPLGAHDKP